MRRDKNSQLRGWMPSRCYPGPPHGHSKHIVQVQRDHRRTSGRCTPNDKRTVLAPAKVPLLQLLPRIQQTYSTPCHGIGSMGLTAFRKVTRAASKPQIGRIIRPAFGAWDDTFDFQRPGNIRLA
jgi:hypothetical protein